ncbi:hypothetical protein BCR34DRAFT_154226 [Clohesyomyces aquaticus]|uniref:Uncharacterized protein n=1 Tax=Clohesyomyces aquaticus TaxID=1231657 RepID=A0A1Y2A0L9_9PLEO|nr:hypothetical protein BCR34DRAFT_154226 [Clohesyomyces aquaticus]
MQRPPVACRRAVRSLSPASSDSIWISDSLLASTFERFFRLTCQHQTRNGSHVPGPLEARRRSAKRRMTAMASASGGVSPLPFSLGALFGLRSSPSPTWRYEPPSKVLHRQPLDPPPMPPSRAIDLDSFFSTAISPILSQPPPLAPYVHESAPTLPDIQEPDMEICLEKFKALLDFEFTGLEYPAQLKKLESAYAYACPPNDRTGIFTLSVVEYLIKEKWQSRVSYPHQRMVMDLLRTPTVDLPDFPSPESLKIAKLVRQMSKGNFVATKGWPGLCRKLATALSDSYIMDAFPDKPTLDTTLPIFWELRSPDSGLTPLVHIKMRNQNIIKIHLSDTIAKNFAIQDLEEHIGFILTRPREGFKHLASLISKARRNQKVLEHMGPVFNRIPPSLMCKYIRAMPSELLEDGQAVTETAKMKVEIWLSILHYLDIAAGISGQESNYSRLAYASIAARGVRPSDVGNHLTRLRPIALMKALLCWLPYHESTCTVPTNDIVGCVESYFVPKDRSAANLKKLCMNKSLAELFFLLQRLSIPNHGIAELVLEFFLARKNLSDITSILDHFTVKGGSFSNPAFLLKYMHHALDEPRVSEDKRFVAQLLHSIRTLVIQGEKNAAFDPILRYLDTARNVHQLENILYLAHKAHLLPLGSTFTRNSRPLMNAKLIHQIAYQCSIDNTRTWRQSARSILYLYKYLTRNQLPIGPLFTQSVTRVFVMRPLMEKHFVDSRRFAWVCGMVRRVEGEHVARKLQEVFWDWRGELIQHAMRRNIELGGRGPAKVSTMKQLRLA